MRPHTHRHQRGDAPDSGWEQPEGLLVDIRDALVADGREFGIEFPTVNPWDPPQAVLLAEAANLMAKYTDRYDRKVLAFAAAARLPGVRYGWRWDDGCFYLAAEGAGEVTAHDPYDELWAELGHQLRQDRRDHRAVNRRWGKPWSGIARQHLALEALRRPAVRRLLAWGTEERVRPQTVARMLRRLGCE